MPADPYSVLELPWGASPEAIRRAFRRLALIHHPDRNPADAKSEARFKLINAAYQRLKASGWKLPAPSPPAWEPPANQADEGEQQPPWPEHWPDGRPIHYPTQAEIDDLLSDTDAVGFLQRLRLAHDWIGTAVAYALYVCLLTSAAFLALLVVLFFFRWINER